MNSEPTLYRIDDELSEMLAQDEGPSLGAYVRRLIQVGVLVPVERCEHDIRCTECGWTVPGAGIGGDDDLCDGTNHDERCIHEGIGGDEVTDGT